MESVLPSKKLSRPKMEAPPKGRNLLIQLERETGVEPATSTLARWRSTTELFPLGEAKNSRGGPGGQDSAGTSLTVPPQWSQTRTDVPPNFFSAAHASHRGRPVSVHV